MIRDRIKWLVAALPAACLFLAGVIPAAAIHTYPVATGPSDQICPRIYADIVVWMDDRNGGWDIYARNLTSGEEFPVCVEPHDQWTPDIWGGLVVWCDGRGDGGDIYALDLATMREFPICTAGGLQVDPAVGSDFITWTDYRRSAAATSGDIYAMDRLTGAVFPISAMNGDEVQPATSGDLICWSGDPRGVGEYDIHAWQPALGAFPVCEAPGVQCNPAVSGYTVVWTDYRAGWRNPDVYETTLALGLPLAVGAGQGHQKNPRIFDRMIVWHDDAASPSRFHVKGYDRERARAFDVSTELDSQGYPSIYGTVIVWEQRDPERWDRDIWAADLMERAPLGWINPGWNWISIPLEPFDPDSAAVFANPDYVTNRLMRWDPVAKNLELYGDDFTDMEVGRGYVLWSSWDLEPEYPAYPGLGVSETSIPEAGWTWIGQPRNHDTPMGEVMVRNDLTGQVRTVSDDESSLDPWINWNWLYWDSGEDTAELCTPYGGDDDTLRPWYGYRVWSNTGNLTLIFPPG